MKQLKPTLAISLTALLFGLLSCSKSDDKVPDPENRTPESFELISVPDDAEGVEVIPQFSWNAATDPDGDMVTYAIYLDEGQGVNPATELGADLTATSFTPEEPFLLHRDYSWKVVAMDDNGGRSAARSLSLRSAT